jgi:hypothetical protein
MHYCMTIVSMQYNVIVCWHAFIACLYVGMQYNVIVCWHALVCDCVLACVGVCVIVCWHAILSDCVLACVGLGIYLLHDSRVVSLSSDSSAVAF